MTLEVGLTLKLRYKNRQKQRCDAIGNGIASGCVLLSLHNRFDLSFCGSPVGGQTAPPSNRSAVVGRFRYLEIVSDMPTILLASASQMSTRKAKCVLVFIGQVSDSTRPGPLVFIPHVVASRVPLPKPCRAHPYKGWRNAAHHSGCVRLYGRDQQRA
jgi:hypothetical protein